MKKILAIILTASLLFSIGGCSKKIAENTKKEIELTVDNIEDYLHIDCKYANTSVNQNIVGDFLSEADIDIKTYSVVAGDFSNVEITLLIDLSKIPSSGYSKNPWHVLGNEKQTTMETTMVISSSGEYRDTLSRIRCFSVMYYDELSGNCPYEIINVSGTFTER